MGSENKSFFSKISGLIIIILCACIVGIQGCNACSSNLKFAQISDVHFSTFEADTSFKLLSESSKLLDDAVSQVNNIADIDFIMFSGDLVNQPQEDQLLNFIQHANLLSKPWYFCFGNHDVSHGGRLSKELYCDVVIGRNKNFCYKKPYYSFTPKKGYKIIALDTIIEHKNTSQGEISKEELNWLKDELDDSKGDVVVIFTHVPVMEPFPSENHRLKNGYELKLLLKKYDNPIIICSGHYHATKIFQEDNILYINSPSLVSYPNAFRVVNICPHRGKILVDVYLKETCLKTLQTKAKNKGVGGAILYGNETDRNGTFELPKKRNRNEI